MSSVADFGNTTGPVPDDGIISRGSKIEASFRDGIPYVDVSYVDGYTYPMYVPILYRLSTFPTSASANLLQVSAPAKVRSLVATIPY